METGDRAIVPAHWPAEVLSATLRGKRRGRVDDAGIRLFLDNLVSSSIKVAPPPLINELHALKLLAERLQLNPHDAAYLDLAIKSRAPLATEDGGLVRAALTEGITLL